MVMRFGVRVVLLAALCGVAVPALGGYQSPLVIPAAAFHENGDHPEAFFFHPNGYLEAEGTNVTFTAAVYLPGSATVRRVTLNAYDNTDSCSSPSVNSWLFRRHVSTSEVDSMASLATAPGASSSLQQVEDRTISFALIDNISYVYFIRVDLCGYSHRLYSVVIDYTE